MNRMSLEYRVAFAVIWLFVRIHSTSAGVCWGSSPQGLCSSLIKLDISREDCCQNQGPTISWTPRNLTLGEIIRSLITQNTGLQECSPCRGEWRPDTCDEIQCRDDQVCIVRNNRTRCVCQPDCSGFLYRGPVCGTDNVNYKSPCSLLKSRCRHSNDINIAYYGECQDSCGGITCPRGKQCVEDQDGRPHCVMCWAVCQYPIGDEEFVCGRDGVTYESPCHLRLSSCLRGRAVGVRHAGRCENFTTCSRLSCVRDKKCVMDMALNEPRCVRCNLTCPERWLNGAVCGNDGNTYPTQCALMRHICENSTYVTVVHRHACNDVTGSAEESGSIDRDTFFDIVEPIAVPLEPSNGTDTVDPAEPSEDTYVSALEGYTTETTDILTTTILQSAEQEQFMMVAAAASYNANEVAETADEDA